MMPHTTLESRAKYCLDWLEKNGIVLHDRNRILVQCRALACPRTPRENLVDPRDIPLLNHASQDVCEISVVLYAFGDRLHQELKSKFELLLKDVPSETDMQRNSVGRDTQFELYVAAVCCLAGVQVTVSGIGPDILGNLGPRRFFIEAKRVKSENKIRKAISKARSQLASVESPGIVALDFTRTYNPALSSHVRGLSQEDILSIHQRRISRYDQIACKELQKSGSAGRVGLMLSRHTMLVPEEDQGSSTSGRKVIDAWSSTLLPDNMRGEGNFYQELNYLFQAGLQKISSVPPQTP